MSKKMYSRYSAIEIEANADKKVQDDKVQEAIR